MANCSLAFLLAVFAIANQSSAPVFAQSVFAQSLSIAPTNTEGIADPAEYQAFVEALNSDNPFTLEQFVTRYPQSGGLEKVLQHGIARYVGADESVLYYWASGEDKVLEFAERLRESDRDDMRSLAAITTLDAKRVSIGKNELVGEMCSNAQFGLRQLPDWKPPKGMTRPEANELRKQMAYTFYLVAGQCAFQNKDFIDARVLYARAVQLEPARESAIWGLTVSDLQRPIDPQGFAHCDKTVQILKRAGGSGRRSADQVAKYCRAVRRSMYHRGDQSQDENIGRAVAEKTLNPFSVGPEPNNAAKPQ